MENPLEEKGVVETPSEVKRESWSPMTVALIIYLLANIFLPLWLWLLILKVMVFGICLPVVVTFCGSALLTFTLLLFHVLLPFKSLRRRCLQKFRDRFLQSGKRVKDVEGMAFVFSVFGAIFAVLGLSIALGFGVHNSLVAIAGETGASLILMFGSFFVQIVLGVVAFFILISEESRKVLKILRGEMNGNLEKEAQGE